MTPSELNKIHTPQEWILPRTVLHCVLAVVILLMPIRTSAQTEWDALSYLQLLDEGEYFYAQAQELEQGSELRRTLLFQAALAKQAAGELVRRAMLGGGLPEDVQALAVQDFFNLNENLMVILIELEQCTAASLLLEQLLSEPSTLPGGATEHLASMRPTVEECLETLPERPVGWDREIFEELVATGNGIYEDAQQAIAADHPEQFSLLFDTIRLDREALAVLHPALEENRIEPEYREQAHQQLVELHLRIIGSILNMELCDSASFAIGQTAELSENLDANALAELELFRNEVADCQQRRAPPEIEQPTESPELGPLPITFLGLSVVAGLSALVYDLALIDTRNDLESAIDMCHMGICNVERANSLADTVDGAKVTLGVLLGVCVVSGTVGLVLWLTDEPAPAAENGELSVTPSLAPDYMGATFEWRY